MKILIIALCGFIVFSVVLFFVGTLVLNNRFDNRPEAREFASGTYPDPAPYGNLKGDQFSGLGKDWLGKQLNAGDESGINNFRSKTEGEIEQRYPFATSKTTGLRNKNLDVLQFNYDKSENPIWMRFIRDELVQTGPGEYLGKIHLKLGPFVVSLGYFRLSEQ